MACIGGMCRSRRTSVSYFTHNPNHRLVNGDAADDGEFTCDGCLVAGAGRRYRCSYPGCGFKLHEVCALHFPKTLKSIVHSQHRLRRCESAAGVQGGGGGRCEVCGEDVKGACYGCGTCGGGGGGIVVHPLCVRLPPVARGSVSVHPGGHDAWLVRKSSSSSSDAGGAASPAASCSACGRGVGAWRYRCGTCKVDVHPRCLVPATDQCRGGEASVASSGKRCCLGLVDAVTNRLAISSYYRGAV